MICSSVCAVIRQRSRGSTSSVAVKVSALTSWRRSPSQSSSPTTSTWSLTANTARRSTGPGMAWWERWGGNPCPCVSKSTQAQIYEDITKVAKCESRAIHYCKCSVSGKLQDFTGHQIKPLCARHKHACVNYTTISSVICWQSLQMKMAPNSHFATPSHHYWC